MTSQDLPQFDSEKLTGGWTEIDSAYGLSPFLFSIPVAIQTFNNDGKRALITGLLTGTEDRYDSEGLVSSIFYFKDSPEMTVQWRDVKGVLVMVATDMEGEKQHE